MRYVAAIVFMLVASPMIMVACMIGPTPATAQSDNQTDEQYCLSLTDHGPADATQARTLGDACFSAANTQRRLARGTSNSRVRQEHLVAAASDFITAAKARFLVGLRGTALAESHMRGKRLPRFWQNRRIPGCAVRAAPCSTIPSRSVLLLSIRERARITFVSQMCRNPTVFDGTARDGRTRKSQ